MVEERDQSDAAGESDCPANKKSEEKDRRADGGHDVASEPARDEMAEDDERTGDSEGHKGERNESKGAAATAPKSPAAGRKAMRASDAFHVGGDDAGGLVDADEDGKDKWVATGTCRVMRRGGIEVTLKQGCDVGRQNRCEELAELGSNGGGVGKKGDDCGCDDEHRKESDYGRVRGCLSKIKEIMIQRVEECAVEDGGDAQESSHGFFP